MMKLGVNIDHVATLRQARGTTYPCPVHAALHAEQHGADVITLHLREDRRHIQTEDVLRLRPLLQTAMNLEIAPTEAMTAFALSVSPQYCCLVPEKREEVTTEGGLNLEDDSHYQAIESCVQQLQQTGISVSLFIDPIDTMIDLACELGVNTIELNTGGYANQGKGELIPLRHAAMHAAGRGLIVHAGHGLRRSNLAAVAAIPEIVELNIGHAIIADAVVTGLGPAIQGIKQILREAC